MKIEHIALYVHDLEKAKDFFVRYFNAEVGQLYHNPQKKFRSYFLSFGNGARLEIMEKEGLSREFQNVEHNGYIHIAFSVGSIDKVNKLTERLKKDGYKVLSGPRTTGDGYYESCIAIIEDNLVEITV